MKLEPLMQRIVELADGVPCRIAYLKDVTSASEAAIRRALLTLTRRGELRSTTVTSTQKGSEMTIDQITDTMSDREARDYIRRQYQSDLQVLGDREALEFARFRVDAFTDMLAEETTRTMAAQRKQIIGLMAAIAYISALAFALGIILGCAL